MTAASTGTFGKCFKPSNDLDYICSFKFMDLYAMTLLHSNILVKKAANKKQIATYLLLFFIYL